jgi:hypothetical protein
VLVERKKRDANAKQMSTLHLHHHSKAKKPSRRLQWLRAKLRVYFRDCFEMGSFRDEPGKARDLL